MLDTRTKVNQISAVTTQTTKFQMSKNEAKTKQNNKYIYIYMYIYIYIYIYIQKKLKQILPGFGVISETHAIA